MRKSNNTSEVFNREKLLSGLYTACAKRHIEPESINEIADSLERELRNRSCTEISSHDLGDMVLLKLRNLDEVAYIRFASVYKDFSSAAEFSEALKSLEEQD